MKEIKFDREAKIITNVEEVIRLSCEAMNQIMDHYNIDKGNKKVKNELLGLLGYYQSILLGYLCVVGVNNKQIDALIPGTKYLIVLDKEMPIIDKQYAGKLNEQTNLKDSDGVELVVGDLVFCRNQTTEMYGIVTKTPFLLNAEDKFVIILENKGFITQNLMFEWDIEFIYNGSFESHEGFKKFKEFVEVAKNEVTA